MCRLFPVLVWCMAISYVLTSSFSKQRTPDMQADMDGYSLFLCGIGTLLCGSEFYFHAERGHAHLFLFCFVSVCDNMTK